MKSIHPTLFVAAILANLIAIRLAAVILPDQLYFSFSAFLFDNRDLVKLHALAAKLAIPFITGFVLMMALSKASVMQVGVKGNAATLPGVLRDQAALTLAFASGTAALLQAWPYILLWDILIDPALVRHRLIFLVAYFAYFVGYGYFALSGAETARLLHNREPRTEPFSLAKLSQTPFTRPFFDALSGSAATILATFLATRGG